MGELLMVNGKRRGVTLMELMIVVAIISVLFAISAPMLQQANRMFIMTRVRIQLQQEARGIMYVLTRNLRQAQGGTLTISRANASQPFYSKITFTKVQGGNPLVFQQEGVYLYQVLGGVKRVLTANLDYMAFTFPRSDDMGIISVSITLKKGIYEGRTKALHMASEKVRIMN
jgi:prepilin-type N-terminal cleavage/methylation domain-containing protein